MAPRFDIDRAMADPSAFFHQPADLLAMRGLTRGTKLRLLRHWEHDARSLAVAEGEGMSGGEESMHWRVLDAIRVLEQGGPGRPRDVSPEVRAVRAIIRGTQANPVSGLLIAAGLGYLVGRVRT